MGREQTDRVLASLRYFELPLVAGLALGVIVLICRWVFATERPAPPAAPEPVDYGLLEPVSLVRTLDDALMLRSLLRAAGIRGTVADTAGGFAVLVFRADVARARDLVRS
ncbi:MAG: hypothetical protein JWP11_994 [Frankiales bacterium]|nr:hypothetical protein [Frankiales bacterium]